MGFLLASTQGS
ncbi:hypothetical protein YPPY32_2749, partial [Yersinia pestis PY-32]